MPSVLGLRLSLFLGRVVHKAAGAVMKRRGRPPRLSALPMLTDQVPGKNLLSTLALELALNSWLVLAQAFPAYRNDCARARQPVPLLV